MRGCAWWRASTTWSPRSSTTSTSPTTVSKPRTRHWATRKRWRWPAPSSVTRVRELRPEHPEAGTDAAARLEFATKVLAELDRRKRRLGVLHFDDLLSRLAKALAAEDSPARQRMHQRWPIVMVDEFQDTDPVQWQVIERAFGGRSTVILIGDPKQAIYAFRGGDIFTYLKAAKTAQTQQTLGVNWRSDAVLVDRLQTVLRGAALGHPDIVVQDIEAHHHGHRLAGAPHNDPFRLRVVQPRRVRGGPGQGDPDRRAAPVHRQGPRRRYRRIAGQRSDIRREVAQRGRRRGHRREG